MCIPLDIALFKITRHHLCGGSLPAPRRIQALPGSTSDQSVYLSARKRRRVTHLIGMLRQIRRGQPDGHALAVVRHGGRDELDLPSSWVLNRLSIRRPHEYDYEQLIITYLDFDGDTPRLRLRVVERLLDVVDRSKWDAIQIQRHSIVLLSASHVQS